MGEKEMNNHTIIKLRDMKLTGMADACANKLWIEATKSTALMNEYPCSLMQSGTSVKVISFYD